jgi:Fe-S cluster biogenesis protein NfuA
MKREIDFRKSIWVPHKHVLMKDFVKMLQEEIMPTLSEDATLVSFEAISYRNETKEERSARIASHKAHKEALKKHVDEAKELMQKELAELERLKKKYNK